MTNVIVAATTTNLVNDNKANPFLDLPTKEHYKMDQALYLEGHLYALATHSSQSSDDNQDPTV